jgi:acyl dehydratase
MTTDSEESLIPPEAWQMVGEALGEATTGTIYAKETQRFAHAVGDHNPIYFDEEAARAAGYEGLVCPPTYLGYATVGSEPLSQLRADGLWKGGRQAIPLKVKRTMFGGEEWDFLLPVLVGDIVFAVSRVKSLEEKSGSSGRFVLITRETTYTNQRGETVARARQLGIAR